ncbi:MFS transporter [Mesobacillus maritimus]|uniref:MFS transporter n=1 Tax=Mesobacillus maritimus TaxID=1643336 RepID=A0ABS7JZ66_9BACI|nr:MFS transporter [Mesobacillus maritimus]MBY0095286.1 MFS transporter [Mesobacillus maritimus]
MNSIVLIRTTFTLITIISILVASNIYTLIPIYDEVAVRLDISSSDVVIAGSLFTLFYAGGLLSFGPISDYMGRKNILVFGLLASAFTTLAVGVSTDVFSLWLTRSIQGFTLASFASVVFTYSFDLFPLKQRTLLVVLINTGFLIAGIFGQLISSVLTQLFSWNSVFFFFSICYLLLFAVAFFLLTDSPKPKKEHEPLLFEFLSLLKDSRLMKCYLVASTLLFSVIAFYDALGRFFPGPSNELFMIRTAGLIGASLSLLTGKLIGRIGEIKTLALGLVIGVISFVAMLFFNSVIGLTTLSICFISSISLAIPTVITLVGSYGGKRRSKALSLYSFILLIGASFAPTIAALFDFTYMLLGLTFLFIINLGICYRLHVEKN